MIFFHAVVIIKLIFLKFFALRLLRFESLQLAYRNRKIMNFSKEELVDMIYVLGESDRNAFLASRVYAAKYPHRTRPDRKSFERLKERFERTGCVDYEKHERVKPATNDENKFMVMLRLVEDPHKSTRQFGHEFPFSASSASRIIRSEKFHPYHIQLLQELGGADYERRLVFCRWAQDMIQLQARFFDYVMFSDESTFHNNGFVNRHNFHYYDSSNPFLPEKLGISIDGVLMYGLA